MASDRHLFATRPLTLGALALFLSGRVDAAVLDAGDFGFTVEVDTTIDAPRVEVYQAFVKEVGRWWSPDLTVSGYSEALYIDARPMGCFCEALAEGGVVHMAVTLVDANSMLRFTGGLGPLGLLGVSGNMTIEFDDGEGGTLVRLRYAVGGYLPGGTDAIAGQVDTVLGVQLERLGRYVETGSPDDVRQKGEP